MANYFLKSNARYLPLPQLNSINGDIKWYLHAYKNGCHVISIFFKRVYSSSANFFLERFVRQFAIITLVIIIVIVHKE